MFKKITLIDAITLFLLVSLAMVITYFYANSLARNVLWQQTYPIRAELSIRQITCSDDSPKWLSNILKYQTRHNNALSNQIAYIDPQAQLHHCENGYIGQYPILSNPITEQTRFRYASVTKLWTSDAILDLIKQDKLELDTRVSEIVTEINTPKDDRIKDITIGQLLLHRAGFDRYSLFGQDMFGIGKDICPNHLERLNSIELGFDPDTKTSYSNLGYCLLGEIISRLNDEIPYKDVIVQKYNFADTSLHFISNKPVADEVYYNYVETGLTGVADIYKAFDYDGLASVAGLSGNAIELAQQVKVMAAKPSPNILSMDDKVSCDKSQITECYGFAMLAYQRTPKSATVYYRDGSLLGLSSLISVDEQGGVVALLSNGTPNYGVDDNVKMMIYDNLTQ